jgi:hypothetical protein
MWGQGFNIASERIQRRLVHKVVWNMREIERAEQIFE